jgi:hypothetical protein
MLAGVLGVLLLMPQSRIDREHFEALQQGMPRHEIERMLGAPRNECSDTVTIWLPQDNGKVISADIDPGPPVLRFFPRADAAQGGRELVWVGKSGLIAVRMVDDRMQEKYFSTVHAPDTSLSTLVISWLSSRF